MDSSQIFAQQQEYCHCDDPFEIVPHVIFHCKNNLKQITERHNSIVVRLKTAASGCWSSFKENQPLAWSTVCPDLVVVKKRATIIDVDTTFDNSPKAFDDIKSHKAKKYQHIANSLKEIFFDVSVEAMVVGAIGS